MIEIKNSSTHESEENEMRKFVTKMEEYICDKLCRKPHEVPDQNSMDSTCTECRIQEFADQILEQYEKYDGIIKCNECVYQAHEKSTDSHWCRLSMGLDGVLQPEDGCSRRKKENRIERTEKGQEAKPAAVRIVHQATKHQGSHGAIGDDEGPLWQGRG